MVEAKNRTPFSALRKLRTEFFGPGCAGRSAFKIIAGGAFCEAMNEEGLKCNRLAAYTVDFNVPNINKFEQTPVCGCCGPRTAEHIDSDISKFGGTGVVGMNGFPLEEWLNLNKDF